MKNSIKNNCEFVRAYHHGKSYANKYLVMYCLKNDLDTNRFGITASKKVGNSVVRHRITRLIRESIRLHSDSLKCGYDIVVVARVTAKDKKFSDIEKAFYHLCKLQHMIRDEKK